MPSRKNSSLPKDITSKCLNSIQRLPTQSEKLKKILDWTDRHKKYQSSLIWAWLIPVTMCVPIGYLNVLLMIYTPQHGCQIPPDMPSEWETLVIPRDKNESESCSLFDYTNGTLNASSLYNPEAEKLFQISVEEYLVGKNEDISSLSNETDIEYLNSSFAAEEIAFGKIGCIFGNNFDKSYFEETLVTRFGWICQKAASVKTLLTISMIGNLIGCIFFGFLADRFGRVPIFVGLCIKLSLLGILFVFVEDFSLLLIVRFFLSTGLPAIYQILLIITLEQVSDAKRIHVTVYSSLAFSVGQVILGGLAWFTKHWVTLGIVCSVPGIFIAFTTLWKVEESLGFLISRKRFTSAVRSLKRIANYNGHYPTIPQLEIMLNAVTSDDGYSDENLDSSTKTIFSNLKNKRTLFFRFLLITICWCVINQVYYGPMLQYSLITTNPFVGWIFLSLVEIPSNFAILFLLKYLGRRIIQIICLTGTSLCHISVALLVYYELFAANDNAIFVLNLVAKLFISGTFIVIYLQAAEIYPTSIRNAATGTSALIAIACNTTTPSILLSLSHTWHGNLIFGGLCILGVICNSFLPETFGIALPQTVSESASLSWKARNTIKIPRNESELSIKKNSIFSMETEPQTPALVPSTDQKVKMDSSNLVVAVHEKENESLSFLANNLPYIDADL